MTAPQPIDLAADAPRPSQSTGPKTPEGKRVCSLNAYRHGLTGQIVLQTSEEQQAYDKHTKIVLEAMAPATDFERLLAQSISDDHWRLNRARAIESSMFANVVSNSSTIGMQSGIDDTGHTEVDDALANAFAQARTWIQEARNLQLLTIYEQRIQRSVDKNTAQLKAIQSERKEQAREAMRQAKLLYQLAEAEGRSYQPEAFFTTAPETRESVFSTSEIARELARTKLLNDAETYARSGELPEPAPLPTTHYPPPTTHHPSYPVNLYPRPRIVKISCGNLALSSSFCRSQATCTSTVRVDVIASYPHTSVSSVSRDRVSPR